MFDEAGKTQTEEESKKRKCNWKYIFLFNKKTLHQHFHLKTSRCTCIDVFRAVGNDFLLVHCQLILLLFQNHIDVSTFYNKKNVQIVTGCNDQLNIGVSARLQ